MYPSDLAGQHRPRRALRHAGGHLRVSGLMPHITSPFFLGKGIEFFPFL